MNASLKSSLFLGTLTLTVVLVLSAVSFFVSPIIEQRQIDQQNQAYLDVLGLESSQGYTLTSVDPIPTDLLDNGVDQLILLQDETLATLTGAVYTVTGSGWGGDIQFMVGMIDTMYTGLSIISQAETRGIGDVILDAFETELIGQSIDDISIVASAIQAYMVQQNVSATFASVTRNGVIDAIDVARLDYLNRRSVA
jgi:Na+-translocating ferredoxin:NAD+ oxidoreductase RnfG subunit